MTINFFNMICFVLAFSAFVKVFFGLFYHDKLYDFARKSYSQEKMSLPVKVLMIYAFMLLITVWIGTIFFYEKHGWILTSFLTIASLKSVSLFFNWKKASTKFLMFINTNYHKLWAIDVFVGVLGLTFLALGLFLY